MKTAYNSSYLTHQEKRMNKFRNAMDTGNVSIIVFVDVKLEGFNRTVSILRNVWNVNGNADFPSVHTRRSIHRVSG